MSSPGTFKIFRLSTTNLNQEFQHSIIISLLRGLAAVEVVAAHLRAQFFPSLRLLPDPSFWYQALAFFTGFAHQAVVIFFLLSGWLVGGSFLNKMREPGIIISYAIDRATRMWIVLIPAFLLTLCIGMYTEEIHVGHISYLRDNEYSVTSFIGNLFGLQDMAVPRFGGNFALWSLANEIWYYIIFPLVIFTIIGKTAFTKIAAATACALLAYYLSYEIVLFFSLWLLGVAFSRIQIDATRSFRMLLLLILAGASVYYRLTGSVNTLIPESFIQDLVLSVIFLLLLSSLQFQANRKSLTTRIACVLGQWFAPFSFTLYVIHVPLIDLLRYMHVPLASKGLSPTDLGDFVTYAVLLVFIVFFAYLFHLPFEAQTNRVRRFIKRVVLQGDAGVRDQSTQVKDFA